MGRNKSSASSPSDGPNKSTSVQIQEANSKQGSSLAQAARGNSPVPANAGASEKSKQRNVEARSTSEIEAMKSQMTKLEDMVDQLAQGQAATQQLLNDYIGARSRA